MSVTVACHSGCSSPVKGSKKKNNPFFRTLPPDTFIVAPSFCEGFKLKASDNTSFVFIITISPHTVTGPRLLLLKIHCSRFSRAFGCLVRHHIVEALFKQAGRGETTLAQTGGGNAVERLHKTTDNRTCLKLLQPSFRKQLFIGTST